MLRQTVSRRVWLGMNHHSEAWDHILLLSDSCGFVDVRRSLWREDGSVVYKCCWPLQLAAIFYCLRVETFLLVASYESEDYDGGIRPRLHDESLNFSARTMHRKHMSSDLIQPVYWCAGRCLTASCNVPAKRTLFPLLLRVGTCLRDRCVAMRNHVTIY
jgi:hypothetical protein